MEWQGYVLAGVFSIVGLLCVLSIPIGLPGTWILLGLALAIELLDVFVIPSAREPITFGWTVVGTGVGLGLIGELIEAGAGAAGTKMGGGSRRGMVGAILGGIVGAIVFTFALPMPLVGTLIGALLGTFAGALAGELTAVEAAGTATSTGAKLRAALGATVGRLAGTLGKTLIAGVIWVMLVWSAFRA